MAKQSSVNLDITNNADGFDISGGTTVRKLGITGGDVTIAGSGSAVVTFPTTSTTIAGLGITQSFSALQSFSAGISAAGGVTLAGTLQGTTANFTGLVSSTIGFSGPGTNITGVVTSFNNQTGAVTGVTVGGTNVFTALNTFNAGISASGGTFGRFVTIDAISFGAGGTASYTPTNQYGLGDDNRSNVAIGLSALSSNIPQFTFSPSLVVRGILNTAIGYRALQNLSGNTGTPNAYSNTALGSSSLSQLKIGQFNLGIGSDSLGGLTVGNQNIGIGYNAGGFAFASGNTVADAINSGIYIGADTRASAPTASGEIVLGQAAVGLGSNTTVIGSNSQTSATIYGLLNAPSGISASGATFSGDIAVNGGDITTTSATATLFNANATSLDILNTQSSGFTLNIGTASTFSGTKTINIGSNIGGGASSQITIGSANSASRVSILGGITLGGVAASVVRVASPSTFDVTATSTFTNSTFSGLLSANAGISASGATFSGDIAVNGGDITTTSATATLYNTTATTVNIGNAASTVNLMGATANTQTGIGSMCYVKTGQTTTTTTAKQEIFRYPSATASVFANTFFADLIITANFYVIGNNSNSQITKMLVVSTIGATINHTEYGNVNTAGNLATYTAELSGNDVIIYATPTGGFSTVFNVYATLIKGTYGFSFEE